MSEKWIEETRAKVAEALKRLPAEPGPDYYIKVRENDLKIILMIMEKLIKTGKPDLMKASLPKLRDDLSRILNEATRIDEP